MRHGPSILCLLFLMNMIFNEVFADDDDALDFGRELCSVGEYEAEGGDYKVQYGIIGKEYLYVRIRAKLLLDKITGIGFSNTKNLNSSDHLLVNRAAAGLQLTDRWIGDVVTSENVPVPTTDSNQNFVQPDGFLSGWMKLDETTDIATVRLMRKLNTTDVQDIDLAGENCVYMVYFTKQVNSIGANIDPATVPIVSDDKVCFKCSGASALYVSVTLCLFAILNFIAY